MLAQRAAPAIGFAEFVVLAAALMATQAIAIDAMLPAFPQIVRVLHVEKENHGQWIIMVYMAGMGVGQLLWGVFSDRFGRRNVILGGTGMYVIAALVCGFSHSFETLLMWRFIHGVAAASVTVVRSVVRDLYSGRHMARVMSLTFMVFLMVPILAPTLGQLILLAATWRYIFFAAGAFALTVLIWAALRLPETLHPEYRMTLDPAHIWSAAKFVLGNRISMCYTLCMGLMFGALMSYVAMVPQIFAEVFHRSNLMPSMFALCAAFMGIASFLNSRIVVRVGMRRISQVGLLTYLVVTLAHMLVALWGFERLWTFVLLQGITMACFSLSVSNFGAMAMEPVGHVAGLGASVQGFVSSFGGALVGALIGRQFNGTTVPLAAGAFVCGGASLALVLMAEKGRLFRGQFTRAEPGEAAPQAQGAGAAR